MLTKEGLARQPVPLPLSRRTPAWPQRRPLVGSAVRAE